MMFTSRYGPTQFLVRLLEALKNRAIFLRTSILVKSAFIEYIFSKSDLHPSSKKRFARDLHCLGRTSSGSHGNIRLQDIHRYVDYVSKNVALDHPRL